MTKTEDSSFYEVEIEPLKGRKNYKHSQETKKKISEALTINRVKKKKKITGIGDPEFRQEVCKKMMEYFDRVPYTSKNIPGRKGNKTVEVLVPCDLPLIGHFAVTVMNVTRQCVQGWAKRYPEIQQAKDKVKSLQENILITNSLLGLYDSKVSIFTMKNILGWRDKVEQKIMGELSVTNLMNTISKNNTGRDLMAQRDSAIDNTRKGPEQDKD